MNWDYPQPFTLAVAPQAADIDGLNHHQQRRTFAGARRPAGRMPPEFCSVYLPAVIDPEAAAEAEANLNR